MNGKGHLWCYSCRIRHVLPHPTTAIITLCPTAQQCPRCIVDSSVYIIFSLFQGSVSNILEENVLQPLLVSCSAITLASETVRSILKIDDIVSADKGHCGSFLLNYLKVFSSYYPQHSHLIRIYCLRGYLYMHRTHLSAFLCKSTFMVAAFVIKIYRNIFPIRLNEYLHDVLRR